MINYNEEKYIVLNLKSLAKQLQKFELIHNHLFDRFLHKRSEYIQDVVILVGLCKFVKKQGKLIIKCNRAIIYDYAPKNKKITIEKYDNRYITVFSSLDENQFEYISDIVRNHWIDETTKEGYEERLALQIAEEIGGFINSITIKNKN